MDLRRVIQGEGPSPRLVISLVRRLPDTSMTHALMRGGEEHFGWGSDRHLLASVVDAVNLNTRGNNNFKKTPKLKPIIRPKSDPGKQGKPKQGKPKSSVAALFASLGGGVGPSLAALRNQQK